MPEIRQLAGQMEGQGHVLMEPARTSVRAAIRPAEASDFGRILAAYETWGYKPGVAPADSVWIAETAGELIGVVRIAPENGVLVLRGMRIAEPWRRRGIGSAMLDELAGWLGERECFCIPYVHLVEFYGKIGFAEIGPGVATGFLVERLAEYQRSGLEVTIMRRSGF